mmetsp:Transcript_94465/g.148678  ORF Transcript_94465/g.148678 Transcript_94465/m.148678 type:complete len:265 (-) Transcript_94465:14-808(-)
MLQFSFCRDSCCDENPCRGEGDSDYPALPIFDDSNFVLETSAQLGGMVVSCDERYDFPLLDPISHAAPSQGKSRQAPMTTAAPAASLPGQVFGSPACLYQPDPTDFLDVELLRCLRLLDAYAQATLVLRRLGNGRYEIDGRFCQLRRDHSQIVVQEEATGMEMELHAYINQAAHVAVSLYRPKHQRVQEKRLSFNGSGMAETPRGMHDDRLLCDDRTNAMQVACIQAKMREQACASQLVNAQKNSARAFAYTQLMMSGDSAMTL